jgi:hypothetical protein
MKVTIVAKYKSGRQSPVSREVKVASAVAREMHAHGYSTRQIAALLGPGVSHVAVYRALKRTGEKANA